RRYPHFTRKIARSDNGPAVRERRSSVDLGEVRMLPAPFEYHRPSSLDEAVQLLSSLDEAKVLAGGQSLIPLLKFRFAAPAHLVDVNRVPGLDGIKEEGGSLRIGALVRHNQMVGSDLISARYPTLAAARSEERRVGKERRGGGGGG